MDHFFLGTCNQISNLVNRLCSETKVFRGTMVIIPQHLPIKQRSPTTFSCGTKNLGSEATFLVGTMTEYQWELQSEAKVFLESAGTEYIFLPICGGISAVPRKIWSEATFS